MVKPYIECNFTDGKILRTFNKDVLSEELVWHRDKKTRVIEVIEGEGWAIQLENQLPYELKVGDKITIQAETYHRVKRGLSNLTILIQEL